MWLCHLILVEAYKRIQTDEVFEQLLTMYTKRMNGFEDVSKWNKVGSRDATNKKGLDTYGYT